MAPNRKSPAALMETLPAEEWAGLQQTIKSQYLPLTHPDEPKQRLEEASSIQQQGKESAIDSSSYWEWNSDVKESNVCVLSTSNIVSNLIQEAARLNTVEAGKYSAETDDMWAEADQSDCAVEELTQLSQQQQTIIESPYWNFPADQDAAKATLNQLLEEERAYKITSGAAAEAREAQASSVQGSKSQEETSSGLSSHSYWTWESQAAQKDHNDYWSWDSEKPSSSEAAKEEQIASILEYEAARQLLMASTIVEKLQQQQQQGLSTDNRTEPSHDEYWTWSEELDQYWDTPAFTAKKVLVPSSGPEYWDW